MYTWNTTIEDTSSILTFQPYSDGAASGGWAPYFQGLGFFNGETGEDSQGAPSVHITQFPGASVLLQFQGTAIYLYGTQNCSYSVTLDSKPVDIPPGLPEGMLFWEDNLSADNHFVKLTASPQPGSSQQLSFDRAVYTNIGIDESVQGLQNVTYDNQDSTHVHYAGSWSNSTSPNVPSDSNPAPYMTTSEPRASASLQFSQAVAVAINGARNWGHWTYNVTLDGATTTYNASQYWLVGDALLFYQGGLNPKKNYTIELSNAVIQDYYKLSLNSFTVFYPADTSIQTTTTASATPTTSETSVATKAGSKSHVGVIVGPVVAAVAAIFALITALFWYKRRRNPVVEPYENPEVPAPFPRNERPDLWYKRTNAGPQMHITATDPVVPFSGKFAAGPPESAPTSSSEHPTSSSASLRPAPILGTEAPPQPASQPATPQSAVNILPGTSARQTPAPAPAPAVDVDHIIELLAHRLDPSARRTAGPSVEEDSPPQYTQ